jgi:hypothetical protein
LTQFSPHGFIACLVATAEMAADRQFRWQLCSAHPLPVLSAERPAASSQPTTAASRRSSIALVPIIGIVGAAIGYSGCASSDSVSQIRKTTKKARPTGRAL